MITLFQSMFSPIARVTVQAMAPRTLWKAELVFWPRIFLLLPAAAAAVKPAPAGMAEAAITTAVPVPVVMALQVSEVHQTAQAREAISAKAVRLRQAVMDIMPAPAAAVGTVAAEQLPTFHV